MSHQHLLSELGRRLREARERSGLSVTQLAVDAGLSRRYVTEAEAGRANVSLLKLADLAHALRTPLRDLCDLPTVSAPPERIALVGLRGAGKSSVGRRLALALEVPFVELDQRVEQVAGLPIGEIFAFHGEEGFHRFEAEALERLLAEGGRVVLAAGGSIVTHAANFKRLQQSCRTVWLHASADEHYRRVLESGDRRPMQDRPRARAELQSLLVEREPLYARCDVSVDTGSRSVEDVARVILGELSR